MPTVGQVSAGKSVTHSALPFRAYNLIFNEWFRDENLSPSYLVNTGDGPDPDTNYVILNRGKRHDYFTSCLPWPQKGPSVNLPLGSSAPVKSGGNSVSNAIDLQSSAGGFTRLNLGATLPLNVMQASAVTAGVATFGLLVRLWLVCMPICQRLRLRRSMLFVLRFRCKSCLSVMRVAVLVIRKLFVLILALFRLILAFSVLSIWGVLVFLSILLLLRRLLLLLSAVLLHPRVIFLLLVLCCLSLVLHNHLLSMALS